MGAEKRAPPGEGSNPTTAGRMAITARESPTRPLSESTMRRMMRCRRMMCSRNITSARAAARFRVEGATMVETATVAICPGLSLKSRPKRMAAATIAPPRFTFLLAKTTITAKTNSTFRKSPIGYPRSPRRSPT